MSMIQVGHESAGKAVRDVAEGIATVLTAGFHARADREVMVEALRSFREAAGVQHVSISGCTLSTNHYELGLEEADNCDDDA